MSLGTPLDELVRQLRAETGASTSAAQGNNMLPQDKQLLKRTQAWLYAQYDWPHLRVETDEDMLAGERYYTFNTWLNLNRIEWARVHYAGSWLPVLYRDDFAGLYNALDSDGDARQDPVQFWRAYTDLSTTPPTGNQFEVWPMPATAAVQTLRFRGIKKLANLVSGTDVADLDDDLIVNFAAARRLKELKSADADSVLAEAQRHLQRLKGQLVKSEPVVMGGGIRSTRSGWPGGDWELQAKRTTS